MSTHVRRAVPADVPALAELAAVTFPLACPPGSTAADQQDFIATVLSAERFAEYLEDPARTVLVAEAAAPATAGAGAGSALVGYTMLVTGEPTDPDVVAALRLRPTVELSKCYVLAGHQGTGVATALMAASVEAAARGGAAGLWLGVNQLNERAHAFYRRSGFAVVGTKHFRVGGRLEDDHVMERPL